ncbi:MAG TPA: ABC transporter ATP-binding protein [Symbiobacteriaceae bacterium]|nr:ABC transporter ATP-binding protein [Symbiobacteriaceae bacterium]
MTATHLAIATAGLAKAYGDQVALRSLNLEVPAQTICGFLGPNGAGKSTTMKLLLGLIRPSAGTGSVCGQDIVRQSLSVRRRVGYLAQEPRFYDHMTARETLRFAARLFYTGPADLIEQRVQESLELTGMEAKADRPVRGFSGGERQRLGIAQAQINRPELLILDEPAAALDPIGRRDVLEVMRRLRGQTTIFYSTHILDDVQRVSDAVAILNQGALVAQGPIGSLLSQTDRAVYQVSMCGDETAARRTVSGQPWVTSLTATRESGHTQWAVSVSSEEAAEENLLRLILADRALRVTGFGRKQYDLEELFVNLVGGMRR